MHIKKFLQLGALKALLLLSPLGALAVESSDVSVKGKIKPTACDIVLSNSGVIDYGTVSATSLKQNTATQLPDRNFDLTVSCYKPMRILIHTKDNRFRKQQSEAMDFLKGTTQRSSGVVNDAGTAVGALQVFPAGVMADGHAAANVETTNAGKTWFKVYNTTPIITWPTSDDYTGWGVTGATKPSAFTTMVQRYTVRLALAPRKSLPKLVDDVPFNGSMTFAIVYI
ncbi:DUF1120 domain-containing protein [Cupriavidus agavae]|uniref:Uncharacterized protein DUF1120 n=1 Tax=Cupriavidus agavae TaxID=1001822 RepID=A0A4Q7S6R7_9BURK|nr:DUF1120 domain-containing protein [Cupriavidus agavae]RZT41557.1 uncharacterized protein DUF1120 [Cupriavidus agavae]